ncbi:hypothetical protein Tco_0989603 [Tanacetum coccineum]|uniref:Uncharacterized protein n=1 Tax=Tanacetum coccineum TaxID=301880 RepID=A0ABQ5EUS4_9ASTR
MLTDGPGWSGGSRWLIGGWPQLTGGSSNGACTRSGLAVVYEVRIEKTKRSKNDQKPTRNGKKTKSQEQDKESARNHSRISPTQSKKGTKKSKVNTIKSRAISDKCSKFQSLLGVIKTQGPKLPKEKTSKLIACGGEIFEDQTSCGRRGKLNLEDVQALLQSLLNDLQILNEIQPLKQDISNQIQKDQRKKIEDMSIEEIVTI